MTSVMNRSKSCAAPIDLAASSQKGKDEKIQKLIQDWKANATRERTWSRIQRLGAGKLKKPSEFRPEDFFPKIRKLSFLFSFKMKNINSLQSAVSSFILKMKKV
jgi:hypothetical protein